MKKGVEFPVIFTEENIRIRCYAVLGRGPYTAEQARRVYEAEKEAESDIPCQREHRDTLVELEDNRRRNSSPPLPLLEGADRRKFWLNCNNLDANQVP